MTYIVSGGALNSTHSLTGNRHPIPMDRVRAVAMIGWMWHATRAAGDGAESSSPAGPVSSKWRRRLSY